MAKNTEKVFEFDGSQNLFTTPIDITGLQGDTYDYELVTFFEDEGLSSALIVNFNNDTGTNYRNYSMTGDGASASAFVTDVAASGNIGGNAFTYPSLGIHKLTGNSTDERVLSSVYSISSSSGDTRIIKRAIYWKNTADELTSIQLSKSVTVTSTCRIILYRTPKAHSQGNWIKVDSLSWAAETAEKSFTGLDGDVDKKYKIVLDMDNSFNIEINNDNSSSYKYQQLNNATGSIAASGGTLAFINGKAQTEFIFNAETGTKRLVTVSTASTSSAQQIEKAFWYSNTGTNITSLDCTPSASATGTATLYKQRSESKEGVLPWELVEKVDIAGIDFSAGHTFSNLLGDSVALYKVTFEGTNTSGNASINLQWNGNTSSVYLEQSLKGDTSTVSAAATTRAHSVLTKLQNGKQSKSEFILYPKTGDDRPALKKHVFDENAVEFTADWYGEIATEITSLKVFSDKTDNVTATLKLWRLK